MSFSRTFNLMSVKVAATIFRAEFLFFPGGGLRAKKFIGTK
jgi:hypothetical protein